MPPPRCRRSRPVSDARAVAAAPRFALRLAVESGANEMHGFGVQLADPGLGHPEHLADLAEAALFLIVEADDELEALGQVVDGTGDGVHDLAARRLGLGRRFRRARLGDVGELEPREAGFAYLAEQALVLVERNAELGGDLVLLRRAT